MEAFQENNEFDNNREIMEEEDEEEDEDDEDDFDDDDDDDDELSSTGSQQQQHNNHNNIQLHFEAPAEEEIPFELPYETPDILRMAVRHLREAILLVVPHHTSETFRYVLQYYPNLIMNESNPLNYLRSTRFNHWEAAVRICDYWTLRKQLFGDIRYCRPVLDLCPERGALSTNAIKFIYSGIVYVLPVKDIKNRNVLFRLKTNTSTEFINKLGITEQDMSEGVFYLLQALTEYADDCKHGLRFVGINTEIQPVFHHNMRAVFLKACRDCFPIELTRINIIYAPNLGKGTKLSSFLNQFVWDILNGPFNFLRNRTVDHISIPTQSQNHNNNNNNNNETLLQEKLYEILTSDKIGLKPEGLPPIAGGPCSFQSFLHWTQQRRSNNNNKDYTNNNDDDVDFMLSLAQVFIYGPGVNIIENNNDNDNNNSQQQDDNNSDDDDDESDTSSITTSSSTSSTFTINVQDNE